jgi:hypothetical protein
MTGTGEIMVRIRNGLAFVLSVMIALVVVAPSPAHAAYFFRPGEPVFFGSAGAAGGCTGGYAIKGTDGLFILTAGHCAPLNTAVYGHDARFGTIAHNKYPDLDSSLIRLTAPNDAYQIVVDPLTGRTPGGSGKVVGVLSTSNFVNGYLVGKMGRVTGWTEGTIYTQVSWRGLLAYCARFSSAEGDSGGPVWRTAPGGGVYAVGIIVARDTANGYGCFHPISGLLRKWGAQLPTFPSGARAPAEVEFPSQPLPKIPESRLEPL